jgi:dihydrodipicolinate synthase/N-acetylneuraminate lyase
MSVSVETLRKKLIATVLPGGIPRLWCPLLTHYNDNGTIDFQRMEAHFNHIVPRVRGYLIPGSTGDGWELNQEETMQVVEFAVRMVQEKDARLLLGVLKPDTEAMEETIDEMLHYLYFTTGEQELMARLIRSHVCGFTVCPPKGQSLDQGTIRKDLSRIMDKDVPIALYQLPQVTKNEAAPETFEQLLKKYPNLIFFKDSSGNDRIALSDVDKGGVFLVRGAEGAYAQWLKDADGSYDGFLLSTANSFPLHLSDIIGKIEEGNRESARDLSRRVTGVIDDVFTLVQSVPCGNAFTNANKAIDHYCAFGPSAHHKEGPRLHGGIRLSPEIISATGQTLSRFDLMPSKGYLE